MTILFFIFGAAFVFIPYFPSLFEIKKATDAAALRITNHILKDPRNEPELIFWQMVRALGLHGLDDLRQAAQVLTPKSLRSDILAIPGGKTQKPPRGTARLIAQSSIELVNKTSFSSKILSFGSIKTGTENLLNEIHSRDTLLIDDQSKVFWWASGHSVLIGNHVKLPGKTQAKEKIQFRSNAYFQLLEAPVIEGITNNGPTFSPHQPKNAFRNRTKITRYDTDLVVEANTRKEATYIVHGTLKIEKNSVIVGDVKARGSVILDEGAQIIGNLISDGSIYFRGQNFVSGTVLAKKTIAASPYLHIGTREHQVTLSGEKITLHSPFQIHGLVRAWKIGQIKQS